ncbi:MAG: DEAD/DEAH box helicase, partial [Verrucomicrobiaceae bacterium]
MRIRDVHGAVHGEQISTRLVRGLFGQSDSWEHLVAVALATIGEFEEYPRDRVDELYDLKISEPLVAAARLLDQASTRHSSLDESERADLALQAAIAFGMAGNHVSATALLRRIPPSILEELPMLIAALATAIPTSASQFRSGPALPPAVDQYLNSLSALLTLGSDAAFARAVDHLGQCVRESESSFEAGLLRSARVCLQHCYVLSTARVLHTYSPNLPRDYVNKIVRNRPLLLPSQYQAIQAGGLLNSDRDFVVCLPPSAGKTFLGELLVVESLTNRNGMACIITPYVALGAQTILALNRNLGDGYRVHRLYGGFQKPPDLDPSNHKEIIVATPERFDALLRSKKEWVPLLRCVVVDEAHSIASGTRGVRLEGIITRLLMQRGGAFSAKLALLSAVVPNG